MAARGTVRWIASLVALGLLFGCGDTDAGEQRNQLVESDAHRDQSLDDREIASLLEFIDGTEIAAARAMLPKLVSPPARSFAQMLIEDHTRLRHARSELTSADNSSAAPPQFRTLRALTHSQSGMFATLPAGPSFDVTFLGVQAANHAMVVDSLRRWHTLAEDDGLRRAIAAAIPVVDRHRERALAAFTSVQGAAPDTSQMAGGAHAHGASQQHAAPPDAAAPATRRTAPDQDTSRTAP